MALISTRIPEDMEKELIWYADKERIGRTIALRKILDRGLKEIKLEYTLQRLAEHKISLGKASEEAGLSLWEMLDIVKEKKIDWVGLTPEDIERDLEIIKKLSKK